MGKKRLHEVKVHEISFVPNGDNPEAHIIIAKKAKMKTEDGEQYPATAFAYAPDAEKPSTWKLRLWDSPGEKETASQVGRAVAALGPGFRGQKVDIPSEELDAVKRKVLEAWRKTHAEDETPPDILTKQEEQSMTMEELTAELEASQAKIKELEAALAEATKAEKKEPTEEEVMKSLPEAVQKMLKDQATELKKAQDLIESERLAKEKLEDEAVTKAWIEKAETTKIGKAEDLGAMFKKVSKHDAELADNLFAEFEKAGKQIEEGELFKEKGKDGEGGVAADVIKAKAEELAKAEGITYEAAYAKVYKADAELRKSLKEEGAK